ncbi:MAG: pitrilysin family protein [Bacteroidota bacterium]|nr:pitrilysin family protein [Bacteroidota bacterium]
MKKVYSISLALLFFASSFVNAQSTATLIKKVEAQPGKLVIPYVKYKLANGLTVIINEDHSDPIVHVELTYHVGSNRETPRRTGFAHFFEHMMFQGSQNVADEEHFKIIQGSGGDMNGTTNRDRTNYYETVPSNMLETALWLEADRMGFLLPAFTQKKFETQRATVKNEKDQRYANGYGLLSEVQDQTLYPYGHPYSWQTIGYVDDLNEADSNDLKSFFLKWYGPNNAILVISGDVNPTEALALVEKYFGSINKGVDVPALPKKPVTIEEIKIQTYESKVQMPISSITYPTVPTFHSDEAPLDILAAILGDGKSSYLYKQFVDDGSAIQASCSNGTFEVSGEFNFLIATYPAAMGGLSEKEIREGLAKAFLNFETNGFTDEDLNRIKKDLVARYYGILETIASKASVLTSYEMLMPNRDFTIQDDINRYEKVTKADIMRVYNMYIKNKNYVCINIVPHPDYVANKNAKIKPYESVNPYATVTPDKSAYQGLVYKPNIDPAGFDRSKRPVIQAAKPVIVPEFYKVELENGIKVIGTKSTETPRVYMNLNIKGGHLFETGKVKNGVSVFLAEMMNEGTKTKTAVQIENQLKELGSSVRFSGNGNAFTCYVECFNDKLSETMLIFEDMLMNPGFDEKDFKTNKKALLQSMENNAYDEGYFGSKKFMSMMYGEDNPIGVLQLSDYSVVTKMTIDDLKNYHASFLSPNLASLTIIGDIDESSALKSIEFLKKWNNKNLTLPKFDKFPPVQKTQIYLVNQDFAKQTNLTMGFRSIPSEIFGDFYKASIMNFALGGAFNSRLNLNIREDKGWTYGIRSGFSSVGLGYPSMFMVSAGVKTSATDSSIAEVMKELKNFIENGITDEELEFTKKSLLGGDALRYESPFDKLGFLNVIVQNNLDKNYNAQRAEIVKNITKEEINALAKRLLSLDNMIIMCVGDDVKIKEGLEKLGYGKVKVLKM